MSKQSDFFAEAVANGVDAAIAMYPDAIQNDEIPYMKELSTVELGILLAIRKGLDERVVVAAGNNGTGSFSM